MKIAIIAIFVAVAAFLGWKWYTNGNGSSAPIDVSTVESGPDALDATKAAMMQFDVDAAEHALDALRAAHGYSDADLKAQANEQNVGSEFTIGQIDFDDYVAVALMAQRMRFESFLFKREEFKPLYDLLYFAGYESAEQCYIVNHDKAREEWDPIRVSKSIIASGSVPNVRPLRRPGHGFFAAEKPFVLCGDTGRFSALSFEGCMVFVTPGANEFVTLDVSKPHAPKFLAKLPDPKAARIKNGAERLSVFGVQEIERMRFMFVPVAVGASYVNRVGHGRRDGASVWNSLEILSKIDKKHPAQSGEYFSSVDWEQAGSAGLRVVQKCDATQLANLQWDALSKMRPADAAKLNEIHGFK